MHHTDAEGAGCVERALQARVPDCFSKPESASADGRFVPNQSEFCAARLKPGSSFFFAPGRGAEAPLYPSARITRPAYFTTRCVNGATYAIRNTKTPTSTASAMLCQKT